MVYPGAVHTRFEHSLGVLHLATILSKKFHFNPTEQTNLRLAALLHDIGHGPFSHSFESIFRKINGEGFDHENITKYLLTHDPELTHILGDRKEPVLDLLFNPDHPHHEIISSDFDIDKMDYFRRDSYHAGVAYGYYDFDRLILCCTLIEQEGSDQKHFGLKEKGMRAYESFRLARFNLWEQVYEHHARLVADEMLMRSFDYALDEGVLKSEFLKISDCEPGSFCNYYKSLDDHSVQHEIIKNSTGKAKDLIIALRKRKLFKRAFITRTDKDGISDFTIRYRIHQAYKTGLNEIENEVAESAGLDSDKLILHVQNSKIKGYNSTSLDPQPSGTLLIKMKNGEVHELPDESPLEIKFDIIRRLFAFYDGSFEERLEINRVCQEMFKAKSLYVPSI